jgi:acetyltransferase (isoleucine patch superfamily)-like protein
LPGNRKKYFIKIGIIAMIACLLKHLLNKIKRLYRISRFRYSSEIIENPACRFGKYTYGEPNIASYASSSQVLVGNFCSIAQGVTILLGGEHFLNRVSTYSWHGEAGDYFPASRAFEDSYSKGNVVIGHDVWLGRNALILSGVNIGDGAVIGAGAVVVKDIPPYAIAAGNPARVIRYRFDRQQIAALEKIQWWNWDDSKINSILPLLMEDSPDRLIVSELGEQWRSMF